MDDRVKTGIKGLDELIEGGLPRGFSYLLLGGPGTGKTTFGVQYLYKGATEYGESGMYVTFDEPPYSIVGNSQRYGWNLDEIEKQRKFGFVDASPIKREVTGTFVPAALQQGFLGSAKFNIDDVVKVISEVKQKVNAKRCVIDSVSALMLQYRDDFEIRQQTLRLIKVLTEMDLTTIMLAENAEDRQDVTRFGADAFLAQGVIVLHMYRVEESNVKALEIRKMRGAKHADRLCPFRITPEGIEVYPEETVFRPT
ncbi:MAG TPA: ATPase domain-containing protein [Methylomirabilota bacterium]|nr:ATPase domain-containing protein [Methylomirabilota bacterium]